MQYAIDTFFIRHRDASLSKCADRPGGKQRAAIVKNVSMQDRQFFHCMTRSDAMGMLPNVGHAHLITASGKFGKTYGGTRPGIPFVGVFPQNQIIPFAPVA